MNKAMKHEWLKNTDFYGDTLRLNRVNNRVMRNNDLLETKMLTKEWNKQRTYLVLNNSLCFYKEGILYV